VYILSLDDT